MNRLFLLLISVLSLFGKSYTWTEKLSVEDGDCDNYELRHVNNDHQYEIDWNGGQVPFTCSFGFIGRDSGYQNEYKVCIEATNYSVSDCSFEMKYKTGIGGIELREKYSCNDAVGKFCGDSDDYVHIELARDYSSENGGKITLKVTADMTYNFAVTVGASVAGAVVGVIILSLCITFIIRRQSNRRSGGLIQTTTTTYNPQTNVYTYSEQRVAHPQMYPNTQQYTEPPPSYQNVVTTSGNLVSPVAGTKY